MYLPWQAGKKRKAVCTANLTAILLPVKYLTMTLSISLHPELPKYPFSKSSSHSCTKNYTRAYIGVSIDCNYPTYNGSTYSPFNKHILAPFPINMITPHYAKRYWFGYLLPCSETIASRISRTTFIKLMGYLLSCYADMILMIFLMISTGSRSGPGLGIEIIALPPLHNHLEQLALFRFSGGLAKRCFQLLITKPHKKQTILRLQYGNSEVV